MGGDLGPRLCVPATLKFLDSHPSVAVSLVGDRAQIEALIPLSFDSQRIRIVHADQTVDASERAGVAFRHKRQSSMWWALKLLADGEVEACVSAGNTGALMAMSRHLVTTFDGLGRPAICKPIPTMAGDSYLLDMGANLECSAAQLLQFAVMGSALARVNGIAHPSVALLNVGAETTKGNQEIQDAYHLLKTHPDINFKGFIEGDQLYSGTVDVIVCDGFVGNVALKVSEGAASFILGSLRSEFRSSFIKKILGALNYRALKRWRERFDPSKYNGAALLGLKKIVIKSHGGASVEGFYHALRAAHQQIESNIPDKLQSSLKIITGN